MTIRTIKQLLTEANKLRSRAMTNGEVMGKEQRAAFRKRAGITYVTGEMGWNNPIQWDALTPAECIQLLDTCDALEHDLAQLRAERDECVKAFRKAWQKVPDYRKDAAAFCEVYGITREFFDRHIAPGSAGGKGE